VRGAGQETSLRATPGAEKVEGIADEQDLFRLGEPFGGSVTIW